MLKGALHSVLLQNIYWKRTSVQFLRSLVVSESGIVNKGSKLSLINGMSDRLNVEEFYNLKNKIKVFPYI